MLPGGNSQSSSVIMAHWAGSGDNTLTVNNTHVRVGVVQYYVLHVVYFQSQYNDTEKVQHIFTYVFWKKTHPNSDFYGITGTVCSDIF